MTIRRAVRGMHHTSVHCSGYECLEEVTSRMAAQPPRVYPPGASTGQATSLPGSQARPWASLQYSASSCSIWAGSGAQVRPSPV